MTKLRNSFILAAAAALFCVPVSAAADTTVKGKACGTKWQRR